MLFTIPKDKIPPFLRDTLGEYICETCEVSQVAENLPPIEAFESSIVKALSIVNEEIHIYIYYALVGDDKSFRKWKNKDETLYFDLKQVIEEITVTDYILCYLMCIIRWEWKDRSRLSLQVLDLGFTVSKAQASVCWCILANKDDTFKTTFLSLLSTKKRIWHKDILTRSASASVDVATFHQLVRELHFIDIKPPENYTTLFPQHSSDQIFQLILWANSPFMYPDFLTRFQIHRLLETPPLTPDEALIMMLNSY